MSATDREAEKVRGLQRAAMDEAAARGATRDEMLDAGARASFDYALESLGRELALVREALGEDIDGGSFLLGSQVVVFAMKGIDALDVVREFAPLLREYVAKARAL